MRRAVVLIAVLISACSTTPSPPVGYQRPPPALCLLPPRITEPCRLPEWYDEAPPEQKAALELQCKAQDAAAIQERDARLADCRAWFEAGGYSSGS